MRSKTRPRKADEESDEVSHFINRLQRSERIANTKHQQRMKEREKLICSILKSPSCFFALESFGDEEVNAAVTATEGIEWGVLAAMAEEAQCTRFANSGVKRPSLLVQRGWAWKQGAALIQVRQGCYLAIKRPAKSLEMVFVHQGSRWEPCPTLQALARRRLTIPCATICGNMTGNQEKGRELQALQKRDYADFLVKNGDLAIRGEAKAQIVYCDRVLEEIKRDGHVSPSSWSNMNSLDFELREKADPEMHRDNQSSVLFRQKGAPSPAWHEILAAVKDLHQATGEAPSLQQVRKRLDATEICVCSKRDGKRKVHLRINSADLTLRAFQNAVTKAIRQIVYGGKKRPRGRPPKNGRTK